jgi:hypothetical protein
VLSWNSFGVALKLKAIVSARLQLLRLSLINEWFMNAGLSAFGVQPVHVLWARALIGAMQGSMLLLCLTA